MPTSGPSPSLFETELPVEPKHSGLGIASFILSVIGALATFAAFVAAGVMGQNGGADNKVTMMVVGLLIVGLIVANLVVAGIGIAGWLQKDRKKVFAILGTILSSLTAIGTILLIAIGLMMK